MIRDFFNTSMYDDRCRPRRVAPCGGIIVTNNVKKTLPAVPRRGPEAGMLHHIHYEFHRSSVNPSGHNRVSTEKKLSQLSRAIGLYGANQGFSTTGDCKRISYRIVILT